MQTSVARIAALAAALLVLFTMSCASHVSAAEPARPRARQLGLAPGPFAPGPLNAITDVAGVRVGHVTVIEGDRVRTGITAIVPHGGNVFQDKVPAAIVVFNGFGKLVGSTQVDELGELETPLLLTNTLSVWDAAAALVEHTLVQPGNEEVGSVNPVAGETNDGWLNDIRARVLGRNQFLEALRVAKSGPVEEGSVGAGTGTRAFSYKGGIGTASRKLPGEAGGYTVGVLVQANYGGTLTMGGVPAAASLGQPPVQADRAGSCMIVLATDAPVVASQLKRLARRTFAGMARTGASFSHGSGDYAIAFSTAQAVRIRHGGPREKAIVLHDEAALSPLFEAAADATEEAIYNAILKATTVRGRDGHIAEALPIERVKEILARRRP